MNESIFDRMPDDAKARAEIERISVAIRQMQAETETFQRETAQLRAETQANLKSVRYLLNLPEPA